MAPGSKAYNPRGRPKGSKNRIQKEVREAILEAGHLAGYDVVSEKLTAQKLEEVKAVAPHIVDDPVLWPAAKREAERWARSVASGNLVDYLREVAHTQPVSFMATLAKILPKQIDVNLQMTSAEVLELMHERRAILAERRAQVLEGIPDAEEVRDAG